MSLFHIARTYSVSLVVALVKFEFCSKSSAKFLKFEVRRTVASNLSNYSNIFSKVCHDGGDEFSHIYQLEERDCYINSSSILMVDIAYYLVGQ